MKRFCEIYDGWQIRAKCLYQTGNSINMQPSLFNCSMNILGCFWNYKSRLLVSVAWTLEFLSTECRKCWTHWKRYIWWPCRQWIKTISFYKYRQLWSLQRDRSHIAISSGTVSFHKAGAFKRRKWNNKKMWIHSISKYRWISA